MPPTQLQRHESVHHTTSRPRRINGQPVLGTVLHMLMHLFSTRGSDELKGFGIVVYSPRPRYMMLCFGLLVCVLVYPCVFACVYAYRCFVSLYMFITECNISVSVALSRAHFIVIVFAPAWC